MGKTPFRPSSTKVLKTQGTVAESTQVEVLTFFVCAPMAKHPTACLMDRLLADFAPIGVRIIPSAVTTSDQNQQKM
eukprot:8268507-Pyramimonas_sp.AAC.2